MRITSLAIALLSFASFTSAQMVRDRTGTWEVGLPVVDTFSETLRGSYGLLEMDTSSATEDASLEAFKLDLFWRF